MNLWENGRQYVSSFFTTPGPQYHGLINQGATCYLNSVLQVLFMTKDFRDAVRRYSSENPENPENEEHIDPHLSAMFDLLEHQTANTYAITEKLGIQTVYEQQDAAEYFQRILQLTSHEASKIFHGVMSHRTSCHKCLRQADVDGPFWCLPLALMDSSSDVYSVEDGVEQYFRATEFRGENQMYCEDCDHKVDADTKYVIKHHPDVLMLLLKRFDFSYRHMSYIKINCAVNVPLMLQIPETHTYELYAAVDHQGDLRSGHYNATIRSEDDDRWYWFDDTSVSVLDQPFQRSQTAYLLFYRKKSTFDHDISSCREVRQSRSDSHQDSDERRRTVCEDPQDAHDRIKHERDTGTDHKEDEQRKDDDDREREIRANKSNVDHGYQEARAQARPKEDKLKHGGSSRDERGERDNGDDREQGQMRPGSGGRGGPRGSVRVSKNEETENKEGEQSSMQKELTVKIIEEEFQVTPRGNIKIKTDIIEIKSLKINSERARGDNEGNDHNTCSDPQLTTNAQEESETVHSNANKLFSESDVEVEAIGTNQAMKKRHRQKKILPIKQCTRKKKKVVRQFYFPGKDGEVFKIGRKGK